MSPIRVLIFYASVSRSYIDYDLMFFLNKLFINVGKIRNQHTLLLHAIVDRNNNNKKNEMKLFRNMCKQTALKCLQFV